MIDDGDEEAVIRYWMRYYTNQNLCSLCGQSGIIHTEGVRSPVGVDVGRANFCICPNGIAQRRVEIRKKSRKSRKSRRMVTG